MPLTMKDAVSSTEEFGLDLYQKLSDSRVNQNCFISPASIAICINMALAGASGATHQAMATGLRLPDSAADSSSAFGELIKALESDDPKVEMNIANAIFVNNKTPLNPSYANNVGAAFKSEIRNENFADSQGTVSKINGWCSEKTKGHIPSIIRSVSTNDLTMLLNAIYFKGKWTNSFPKSDTIDGDFAQPGGDALKVKYMSRHGKFDYFEEADFQAVQLPYGTERFEAIVFLPSKAIELNEFRKRFTKENWAKWMTEFASHRDGSVVLPRFHIDYSETLNDALVSLGFGNMFSEGADFSKMHTPPPSMKVSKVVHKTTLDVDEEGTVATAVTGMMVSKAMFHAPEKSFEMIVNRPFVFAIRDTKTGTLLFMGSVNKPDNKVDMR